MGHYYIPRRLVVNCGDGMLFILQLNIYSSPSLVPKLWPGNEATLARSPPACMNALCLVLQVGIKLWDCIRSIQEAFLHVDCVQGI